MNKKMMVYALTGISALSFLSFGSSVSAKYELICGGNPLATFQRTVTQNATVMYQKISDIDWKGDSSLRTVSEGQISPTGELADNSDDADGLEYYLSQFGTFDLEFGEMGEEFYTLDGEKVDIVGVDAVTPFWYHPVLKKLYATQDITELKSEVLTSQNSVYKSQAGLVECLLKKDGKSLESGQNDSSKIETPLSEKTAEEDMKEQSVAVKAQASTSSVVKVVNEVANLSNTTYETDKKGYLAIKNQPLFVVVKNFGLDFKKDRKALAEYFGIKNYVGSYNQNMKIKTELLGLIVVR